MSSQLPALRNAPRVEEQLTQAIGFANQLLNRNYLIGLSGWPVEPVRDDLKRSGSIRLYKINKIVFDTPEAVNSKLVTVYNSLSSVGSSVLMVADSDGVKVEYYLGIRSGTDASMAGNILEKALQGNFPGSNVEALKNDRIEALMSGVIRSDSANACKSVASVSIVPSERGDGAAALDTQSIETFFDTMAGSVYTAVIIAEPVGKDVILERKLALERMHTALSPHVSATLSYGENESEAVAESVSQSTAATLGESRSKAFGGGQSQGQSQSSQNTGLFGGSGSSGSSYTSSSSWTNTMASSQSNTRTEGSSSARTATSGVTKNMQVTHKNKTIENMMGRIERQLTRIKSCEAFGLWECAAYFISQDPQTTVIAANTYRSMMSGDNSDVENAFINSWTPRTGANTRELLEYAKVCAHPAVLISDPATRQRQTASPASLVSGNELPLILGLPKRSVTGLTTIRMAGFGRNVFTLTAPPKADERRRVIRLGKIRHMGVTGSADLELSTESLTSHCFICGSTGSGKSNTVYLLLEELVKNGVKFLVIEPAKGEYRREFGNLKGVNIYTTNPGCFAMLQMNPFQFPQGIHVLEHLDRLTEIFGACWPMFGSMPAILKQGLERIYQDHGWDLVNSVRVNTAGAPFPTFVDLLKTLPGIIKDAGYSKETISEYTGALLTRVKSLTSGIPGQILCSGVSIPNRMLFDENTVIDLSRVGSSETKSLIMGILILRLNEYRAASAKGSNRALSHVTVLEEAHNILKRVSTTQSQDSANVAGKAVELLSASIAEMRTYGEGFIIVDQSPGAVDAAAIKNTNTKIIMRLPDKDDCETVGKAASMSDDQISELSRLPMGCAVVYQGNWLEPVMARVRKSSETCKSEDALTTFEQIRGARGKLLRELYSQYDAGKYDLGRFAAICKNEGLNSFKQGELLGMLLPLLKELEPSDKKPEVMENATARLCSCLGIFDMYPVAVDKTALERPVPTATLKKLRDWFLRLRDNLPGYVDLGGDEALAARAVNFLLNYMGNAGLPDSPKYRIILRALNAPAQK
jgi:hypothetical protein